MIEMKEMCCEVWFDFIGNCIHNNTASGYAVMVTDHSLVRSSASSWKATRYVVLEISFISSVSGKLPPTIKAKNVANMAAICKWLQIFFEFSLLQTRLGSVWIDTLRKSVILFSV